MKRKQDTDTKVIGTKPIEQMYEEAWAAIANEGMHADPPEGPGWKSDRQLAEERGIKHLNVQKGMEPLVKSGQMEVHEQRTMSARKRVLIVRWYRPVVK